VLHKSTSKLKHAMIDSASESCLQIRVLPHVS